MSEENVEVVRAIYEGWATGDFRAGVHALDRHIVLVVRQDFPEFGVFVGVDGIRDYMRRFLDRWEQLTVEAEDLQAVGDTVVARVVQHGKGRPVGSRAINGTSSCSPSGAEGSCEWRA